LRPSTRGPYNPGDLRFSCESCQTRYTIADEKVHGRVLKVRCKTCGAAIMVREAGARNVSGAAGTATPPEGVAGPITPPAPSRPLEWYAMIAGKQEGPLSEGDLRARFAHGAAGRRSYV
jgi:predicted Zn finger-like uncharacterized protein